MGKLINGKRKDDGRKYGWIKGYLFIYLFNHLLSAAYKLTSSPRHEMKEDGWKDDRMINGWRDRGRDG